MDKTPEKIVGAMIERCQSKAEASLMAADIAAAVIAHVTPQIRSAAIEDAAKAIETEGIDYAGFHANMVRALAQLPQGHVCVPADSPIKAKTLEWSDSGGEWMDSDFGFQISCKPDGGKLRYEAAWGEGDPEEFTSFADAKAWCQKQADYFITKWAMLAAAKETK